MDMILHTHEHLPLPCSEDKLERSKFQMSKPSANKRFYHYVSPLPTVTYRVTSARSLQNEVPFGTLICFAKIANLKRIIRICMDYLRKFKRIEQPF